MHEHLVFDQFSSVLEGREQFRRDVDLLFKRNGIAFTLDDGTKVVRLGPPEARALLSDFNARTGDTELDAKLLDATSRFLSRDPKARVHALEKLWDAFERLKTLEFGGGKMKARSIQQLLGRAVPKLRIATPHRGGVFCSDGDRQRLPHSALRARQRGAPRPSGGRLLVHPPARADGVPPTADRPGVKPPLMSSADASDHRPGPGSRGTQSDHRRPPTPQGATKAPGWHLGAGRERPEPLPAADILPARPVHCHSVQLMSISMGADDKVVNEEHEETRPLAGLPGADRTLLTRAPLELAIVEVRFAGARNLADDAGLQMGARLGAAGLHLTRLEPRQTQRVNLTPGAAPTVEVGTNGWLLANQDGTIQVTLLPEAAVFQTAIYHRWSTSMRPSLEAVLAAVGELAAPPVVIRIGLRYVNRFVDPAAATVAAWKGRIDERFLGPICHPHLGDLVKGSQQQLDLAFSDSHGAILRHGPFVDERSGRSVSYLLDVDCYDSTPSNFNVTELANRAEVLNRTAASLFQSVITEDYRHQLPSEGQTDGETTTASEGVLR